MRTGGFIYAIGAEGSPHVKIGHTRTAVKKRLRALQIGHPSLLHILATVPVDDHLARIEKQIHRFLADQQQQGEWFAVPVDQAQLEALIVRAAQWLAAEEARKAAVADAKRLTALAPLEFCERLRRLRERKGYSQNRLAKESGVAQAIVQRLEAGARGVDHLSVGVARKLAKTLGVSVDHLIGMYEDEHRPAAADLIGV